MVKKIYGTSSEWDTFGSPIQQVQYGDPHTRETSLDKNICMRVCTYI